MKQFKLFIFIILLLIVFVVPCIIKAADFPHCAAGECGGKPDGTFCGKALEDGSGVDWDHLDIVPNTYISPKPGSGTFKCKGDQIMEEKYYPICKNEACDPTNTKWHNVGNPCNSKTTGEDKCTAFGLTRTDKYTICSPNRVNDCGPASMTSNSQGYCGSCDFKAQSVSDGCIPGCTPATDAPNNIKCAGTNIEQKFECTICPIGSTSCPPPTEVWKALPCGFPGGNLQTKFCVGQLSCSLSVSSGGRCFYQNEMTITQTGIGADSNIPIPPIVTAIPGTGPLVVGGCTAPQITLVCLTSNNCPAANPGVNPGPTPGPGPGPTPPGPGPGPNPGPDPLDVNPISNPNPNPNPVSPIVNPNPLATQGKCGCNTSGQKLCDTRESGINCTSILGCPPCQTQTKCRCNVFGQKVCDFLGSGFNCATPSLCPACSTQPKCGCDIFGQKVCDALQSGINCTSPSSCPACSTQPKCGCNVFGQQVCDTLQYGANCVDTSTCPACPTQPKCGCNTAGQQVCDTLQNGNDCTDTSTCPACPTQPKCGCNAAGQKVCDTLENGENCTDASSCSSCCGDNPPPSADTLTAVPSDYCSGLISFKWNFRDSGVCNTKADTEKMYRLQVSTNSNFDRAGLIIDKIVSTKALANNSQNIETFNVAPDSNSAFKTDNCKPFCKNINYKTSTNSASYYWRVRVWSSTGENSGWINYSDASNNPITFTYPWKHPAPIVIYSTPSYDLSKTFPHPGDAVYFADTSICSDNNGNPYPCKCWNTTGWLAENGVNKCGGASVNSFSLTNSNGDSITVGSGACSDNQYTTQLDCLNASKVWTPNCSDGKCYSWNFTDSNCNAATSNVMGDVTHKYCQTNVKGYMSSSQVCDEIGCCSAHENIPVKSSNSQELPIYKEIPAFQ